MAIRMTCLLIKEHTNQVEYFVLLPEREDERVNDAFGNEEKVDECM